MSKATIFEKKRILDAFFKVDEVRLTYQRFDGTMSDPVRRLSLERGDSVAALLYHRERNRLILVNQFRYPTYDKGPGWITEVVAGMVDEGETFEQAVRREVLEETGYQLQDLEQISTFYTSPGGSSERIILFYGLIDDDNNIKSKNKIPTDEEEDIKIIEIQPDEAMKKCEKGEIIDAKTLIAIFWFRTNRMT